LSYGGGEPYRFARLFAQAIADEHGVDSGSFARRLLFEPEAEPAMIRRFGGAIAAIARTAAFDGWKAESAHVPADPAETAVILGEVGTAYVERLLETDGPRVVVLDDVHWIDTSSVGFLKLIVRAAAARPLVVIATNRPGTVPAWATLPHVDRIDLAGLTAAELTRVPSDQVRFREAAESADEASSRRPRAVRGRGPLHLPSSG